MRDYDFILDTYIDYGGDTIYLLDFNARDERELVRIAETNDDLYSFLYAEIGINEGVEMLDGSVFYGADLFDLM